MIVEELYDASNRFANIDKDLTGLKWMIGFNLALSVTILFKIFT